MSGCTMSTARMPIIVFQAENSQSCSPPVTSIDSASATCLGLLEFPIGAGLLEMRDALRLEHAADFDRPGWRIAGIGIDELGDAVAQRPGDQRHDRFGASRPFVPVAAAFGADAPLEGVETLFVAQPQEAVRASSSGVMSRFIDEA